MTSMSIPWPDLDEACGGNPQEHSPQKSQKSTYSTSQLSLGSSDRVAQPQTNVEDSPRSGSKRSDETNPNQGDGSSGNNSGSNNPNGTTRKNSFEALWNRANEWISPEGQTTLFDGRWAKYLEDTCVSPCQPRFDGDNDDQVHEEPVLGISRLMAPAPETSLQVAATKQKAAAAEKQVTRGESAADRRRYRHLTKRWSSSDKHEEIEVAPGNKVQVKMPPTNAAVLPAASTKSNRRAPLSLLEVEHQQAAELERSISELTMRSSYGGGASLLKIPDNRRMAYYAVGKHHRNAGRGGNRRCYFTGKLILGGAPFYAGSVQQGLRTLVVFCLPSALGLPEKKDMKMAKTPPKRDVSGMITAVAPTREHSKASGASQPSRPNVPRMPSKRGETYSIASKSLASRSALSSRFSSLDDLSLSIDGDLDANWGLDRDWLLSVLPEADKNLLQTMSRLYPEQFETLPVQVRDYKRWKLYTKFCFFSGLPIAQCEMHYKVRDDIAEAVYGEEIVLSHEVMEAVNGESAEILTLPNIKAFRYLKKHYAQQCSKLEGDKVFTRTSWERVLAEV